FADLLVGQAAGGEIRDAAFLPGQRREMRRGGGGGRTGGTELGPGPLGPGGCAEPFERLRGQGQRRPCRLPSLGGPGADAVGEADAGEFEGEGGGGRVGFGAVVHLVGFGGVGGGHGEGAVGDEGEAGGEVGQVCVACREGVSAGLFGAAGVEGRFD